MNYKALFAVLFAVLAFAYLPLLISAQADSSTVLSAVTGLSQQLSTVEDSMMLKLGSIDQKLTTLQVATGANIQSLVPMLQALVGLVAVTLVLCIVNLVLLLRRPKQPKEAKEAKAKT